jgi:tetratricopeptide (TPR) repeat protein
MLNLQTAEQLISSSRPRGNVLRGPMFTLLGLSVLLGALSADTNILPQGGMLSWLLPQLVVLAVACVLVHTIRKQRALTRDLQEGLEAVQLRQWPRALLSLRRVLGKPVPHPAARAESLLALAAVAEANDAFDASQRIYECMLEERQADPVQLHTARVGLGGAMLRTGQTTDAVGLIDRLEREDLPGSLRAHSELLALFREIAMGHAVDQLDRAESRQQLFRRHLGTRAGYGYGLLAAAFDVAGKREEAQRMWHDATLLIPADELVRRFAELRRLAETYTAAPIPAGLAAPTAPSVSAVEARP